MKVQVYTDGSANTSTKNGGWGVYLVCDRLNHKKELNGSSKNTTNNLMELEAIIQALKAIRLNTTTTVYEFDIFTDSKYSLLTLLNRQEYETKAFKKVKNVSKIKELYALLDKLKLNMIGFKGNKLALESITFNDGRTNVVFKKVLAHSGVYGNEKADELAYSALNAL